jgi:hypothetical protein
LTYLPWLIISDRNQSGGQVYGIFAIKEKEDKMKKGKEN